MAEMQSDLRIWKYAVPLVDEFVLDLPDKAQIISVQTQRGSPQMWVVCNPNRPTVTRTFAVIGTGNPIPTYLAVNHLGTIQVADGDLHVFEVWK